MHGRLPFSSTLRLTAIATLSLGFVASASGAAAQAGNDAPANNLGPEHPAHIHEGTCEDLGEIVYPLFDVTEMPIDVDTRATPNALIDEPETVPAGESDDTPEQDFATDTTTPEVSLDDLMDGEYAINVHQSEDEMEDYIACGEITGEVEDDTLIVTLQALNDSGYSGEATLIDIVDGETSVTITMTHDPAAGTPAATPGS